MQVNWKFWVRFFGAGWMVGGVIGLVLIIGCTIYLRAYAARAIHTTARVVELREETKDESTMFRPIYEYTDSAGASHRFASSMASRPAWRNVGETVAILYDPANPADAREDPVFGWFPLIIGCVLTAVFGGGGAFIYFFVPRLIEGVFLGKQATALRN